MTQVALQKPYCTLRQELMWKALGGGGGGNALESERPKALPVSRHHHSMHHQSALYCCNIIAPAGDSTRLLCDPNFVFDSKKNLKNCGTACWLNIEDLKSISLNSVLVCWGRYQCSRIHQWLHGPQTLLHTFAHCNTALHRFAHARTKVYDLAHLCTLNHLLGRLAHFHALLHILHNCANPCTTSH